MRGGGGDGSRTAPYRTIQEGVHAAVAGDTVYVCGGAERAYNFADCDDAVLMDKENVKLVGCDAEWSPAAHYSETNKMVRLNVAGDYASKSYAKAGSTTWNAPIVVSASGCSVSGLYCLFGNKSFAQQNMGGTGLIYVTADDATIGASHFKMTDAAGSYSSVSCLVSCGLTSDGRYPERVRIEKIYCWMGKYRAGIGVFYGLGDGSGLYESFIENVDTLFNGPQYSGVFLNLFSNIFLNCANESNGWTNYLIHKGGNGYPAGGEIAYNRFIHNDGSSSCYRLIGHGDTYNGCWNKEPIRIHHNTIVGYDEVFSAPLYGNYGSPWKPEIFDNLIVAPNGTLFIEDAKALWKTNMDGTEQELTSSFIAGSTFIKNATYCPTFVSGSATSLAGYDLEGSLTGEGTTIELSAAPVFLNTDDPASADFYRLNTSANPWVANGSGGSEGTYPTYIGALEPAHGSEAGEFFYLDSLTETAASYFAPAEVAFTVAYGLNGGDVTIYWDFDGDGVFDKSFVETSTEPLTKVSVTNTYPVAGVYTPQVKIVDSATGKELVAHLATPQLPIAIETIYVDANAAAGGDGTPERPFKTIPQGLAVSGAGSTVHVRGGADRLYAVASDGDTLTIAAAGTTLRAYGDEGRVNIRVSDTFKDDGGTKDVVTISAADVTLSGFSFVYGPESLKSGLRLVAYSGDHLTLADCHFEGTQAIAAGGSGMNGLIAVSSDSIYPTGLKVVDSEFVTIRGTRHDRAASIFTAAGDAMFARNLFTNCYGAVHSSFNGQAGGILFVSNVVYAAEDTTYYAQIGAADAGFFRSSYKGLGSGEYAYNVFLGPTNQPLFNLSSWQGFTGKVSVHHNVIKGFDCVFGHGEGSNQAGNESCPFEFFDNLIEVNTVFIEDTPDNAATMFKSGSFFRNNAYLAPNGIVSGRSTELSGYSFAENMALTDNIVLMEPATFINTADRESDNFYRPRETANPTWATKRAAWTDDGKYPAYIGAVEPVFTTGFLLLFR
ncbi:MAG: hypothetical protein ACI4QT_02050 [Kiritimatiellia bacterium]